MEGEIIDLTQSPVESPMEVIETNPLAVAKGNPPHLLLVVFVHG
jgi:hypothetical protein